jgi:hypothetical protein
MTLPAPSSLPHTGGVDPAPHALRFSPTGEGAGLYTDRIDLRLIGTLDVCRASQVEFEPASQVWEVSDFTGHIVFAHPSREACLRWERETLDGAGTTAPWPEDGER